MLTHTTAMRCPRSNCWLPLAIVLPLSMAVAVFAQTATQPAQKTSAPEAAVLIKAQAAVAGIYKTSIDKAKTPEEKGELAAKLLQAGTDTPEDAVGRYALWVTARDMAVAAGDVELVLRTIDQMGQGYQIDTLASKADSLLKMVGKATSQSADHLAQIKRLDSAINLVIDQALAEDQYEVAQRLAQRDVTLASSSKDAGLQQRAAVRVKDLVMIQRSYSAAQSARTRLQEDPLDPAANLTMGRFYCLVKGDWQKGLPLLAQGGDTALKQASEKDMAAPKDAIQQAMVGDAWWDITGKEPPAFKRAIQTRSAYWYRKAAPELTGLAKARVEQRLDELAITSGPEAAAIDLLSLIQLPTGGTWKLDAGSLVSDGGTLELPYQPPPEYDLIVVAERIKGEGYLNVRLITGDTSVQVYVGQFGGSGMENVDGWKATNSTHKSGIVLPPGKAVTLTYQVRNGGIRLLGGDNTILDWRGTWKQLSTNPMVSWPARKTLCLGIVTDRRQGDFRISRCELVPISGGRGARLK
ncbi:MAG: hypothetical protein K8S99_12010 [Planctomycetes bacterium]|nr:hypothetical protein [Planctomycetota bacterium]